MTGTRDYGSAQLVGTYTGTAATGLTNNVSIGSLSGSLNSWRDYYFDVTSGHRSLTLSTGGGSGDLDLYVKQGSLPTRGSYLDISDAAGNAEEIVIPTPTPGRYYVSLYGYESYSSSSLLAFADTADLKAGTVTVTPASPTTAQTVGLSATVTNTGSTTETYVDWQLKVDGVVVNSGQIASLAPGASVVVTASALGPYAAGAHTAQLVVDHDNTCLEINESNNTSSQGFTATSPATKLGMLTQPAGAVTGVAFTTQPQVELLDASNAAVFQAGVTVTVPRPAVRARCPARSPL